MKILNLHAGIGGNRKKWKGHQVTAIEIDVDTAEIYRNLYPEDEVIVCDAMSFLLENYNKYDFIWSSPPCPTHSRINTTIVSSGQQKPRFADMQLYQIIIFLSQWYKGKFVVENVIPYYEVLIPAKKIDRHLYWANFAIGSFDVTKKPNHETATVKDLEEFYNVDLSEFNPKGVNTKLKMLRNMVHPDIGEYILNCALGIIYKENVNQLEIF
ncbi:class I SAM-dependent methyltransferase [Empedobacter sp. GD03797]|uniref:class I SAM-dependent methyltransferase n=1 Tax=Empedobacter sp. GD03797 TaxID=2975382 RepID=UPI002447B02C|nr:DNA cytosine methyltransferase [Empedobacter sp. GD03797]MDH1880953.1 DNA cytosine methyltransferase [Empedobacter sp. GD03797]